MKLVLTLNELKAGNRLMKRIGIAGESLANIVEGMEDGQTLTQEEMLKKFEFDLSDKVIAEMNENKKVMTATKHMDGNGTTCLTIIISEEFVCDINELYGDLVVETVGQLKAMVSTLKFLFKDRIHGFLDKWSK